jgi:hypothetical protein
MNSDVAEAQWKAQCPKWVNRVILAERRPLRSTPISRHFQSPSACFKGANRRHRLCSEFTAGITDDACRELQRASACSARSLHPKLFHRKNFIPRTDIVQNYGVGGCQTLNLRLVLSGKDRQPPPTFP